MVTTIGTSNIGWLNLRPRGPALTTVTVCCYNTTVSNLVVRSSLSSSPASSPLLAPFSLVAADSKPDNKTFYHKHYKPMMHEGHKAYVHSSKSYSSRHPKVPSFTH